MAINKPSDPALRRSRLKLLAVFAVFALPVLAAGVLTLIGWQPSGNGSGQPILPQRNFVAEQLPVTLADGSVYPWRDSAPRLTLVALAGPNCAVRCVASLTAMAKARVMLNRNQSRLRLLYLGAPPAPAASAGMRNYWRIGTDPQRKLAAWTASEPDSVSALLVESNGTALAYYPAGFDAAGLARDLQKVVR